MCRREWVEVLTAHLSAMEACAVVEHLFGVMPLLALFRRDDTVARIASGVTLGALGLFTPSPDPGWGAVPLTGDWRAGALRVCGEVRVSYPAVEGAMVLVRIAETEQRLAWLDLHLDGIERRASRGGESAEARESAYWLSMDGTAIDAALVSPPVTIAPAAELYRQLEEYASVWALAAAHVCKRIVLALRRAARTNRACGALEYFSESQLVAASITELEIETDLLVVALRHGQPINEPATMTHLALALSAARMLAAATKTARQLHDQIGLPLDAWLADAARSALPTYLGGTLMLENEIARGLGLRGVSAMEAQ